MTCIVGFVEKGKVTIGGDSAGVAGLSIMSRKDTKVFQNGPFIMGFTSSFRMGQLLMSSSFKPPRQNENQSDYDFMVTKFVDAIKHTYSKGGFSQKYTSGDDKGGTFIVGYKGNLYFIEDDYQVGIVHDQYLSVGCGEEIAKGAMFALEGKEGMTPVERITIALNAASYFSGGVNPPFNFVEMDQDESIKIASLIPLESKVKKKNKKKIK